MHIFKVISVLRKHKRGNCHIKLGRFHRGNCVHLDLKERYGFEGQTNVEWWKVERESQGGQRERER